MCGADHNRSPLFSYVNLEDRTPRDQPLRRVTVLANLVLRSMCVHFVALDAEGGRPSIAPGRLLRASLLQCLFSIRSERALVKGQQLGVRSFIYSSACAACGAWLAVLIAVEMLFARAIRQRSVGQGVVLSGADVTVQAVLLSGRARTYLRPLVAWGGPRRRRFLDVAQSWLK